MKTTMSLILLLLNFNLWASETLTVQIRSLETSLGSVKQTVVQVKNNNIEYYADRSNLELDGKLKTAKKYDFAVDLEVDGQEIKNANIYYQFHNQQYAGQGGYVTPMTDYSPNNIPSIDLANTLFGKLYNEHRWWDQCFNRALIWSKQMYDISRVKSMKILIYYTQKYRNEVSKKWWFHIAPMVSVNGQLYVMDREFTRGPKTPEEWEDIFTVQIKDKKYNCKKIDNISEYYDQHNMENEYCNIQFTSMYYWEPRDMSRLEKEGTKKTGWVNWEIRAAAKEAFKEWRKIYKRHMQM